MPPLNAALKRIPSAPHSPLVAFLLLCLLAGGLTFQVYGASWDEPNFYDYAAAVPYAYDLQARLSGSFDLQQSFGPLAEAHKMYGPAYLLTGGWLVKLLTALFQVGWYAGWHLVNFLSFQLGVVFFYLLCLRWLSRQAAFAATLLFSTQPVLWGHAFVNPKDIPFMSLFILSLYLGFRGFDRLLAAAQPAPGTAGGGKAARFWKMLWFMLPAGIAVGFLTSVRIIGPFAGMLIAAYAFLKFKARSLPPLLLTALIALLVNYLTWPYLWENPLQSYQEVIEYMADNPVILSVLFGGNFYRSNDLPAAYFPVTLFISFTEVVFPLFFMGLAAILWKKAYKSIDWRSLLVVFLWFLVPFVYVVALRPAMYDSLRHFIFILPPIFVCAGFALQHLLGWLRSSWMKALLVIVLVFPGLYGITRLFPYEYAYYNAFIGGTAGAFRQFETDYWLTCYKEAVQALADTKPQAATLYVMRNPVLAGKYAPASLSVEDLAPVRNQVPAGSLVLLTTRFNDDLNLFPDSPPVLSVGRESAVFCVVREVK